MLASVLTFLRTNPMPDTVFREITGNNIPHVVIVRNKDELIDQSISQFGNTAAYFGTGLLMDKTLNHVPTLLKLPLTEASKPWFFLGKSLSLFSLVAAVNLGMPFLRNYFTTRRIKTNNYAEMVGEKKRRETSSEELAKTLHHYLGRFFKTVGVGIAVSATLMLGFAHLARKAPAMPKILTFLNKHLGLHVGEFKNFGKYAAVAFWVVPTFSGLLAGARDKYEVKELVLRFAAFNLAFFAFPFTVEKLINHAVKGMKPTRLLGPSENLAYVGRFISSLIFCSAVPTVLNIHLTRQRVKRDEAMKAHYVLPSHPPLPIPKTFLAFPQ